jgi:ATP-dependent Lon protease, bacterial type
MYTHDKNKRLAAYLKQIAAEQDGEELEIDSLPTEDHKEPKRVRVFDVEQLCAIKDAHSKSSNQYKNINRVLSQLEGTDGYLSLVELPESILDDLDSLANRFPNFVRVIDYYKQEFALARLINNPIFSAQPLLISGPPGVGKTLFCLELSKIINTHFELVSMSSMTAGFIISGSSSKWGESSNGKVVQAFAVGKRANPLITLDEVDKNGGDRRYDILGSLYTLLEKETASKFIDEALEVPINAAHVVWVATANYVDQVPEPILSRFTVVEVTLPTIKQMSLVLRSVYSKVRDSHNWGSLFQEELHQSVIEKLVYSKIEPRLLQKVLISACGRAVLRATTNSEPDRKLEITVKDLMLTELSGKPTSLSIPKNTMTKPDVVVMPIFNIPKLTEDHNPEETIINWSVREIDHDEANKCHHLVGYIPSRQTGRVTSQIQEFDRNAMQLKTWSGRKYILEGPPGLSFEGDIAWEQWKEANGIKNEIDVTHQYWIIH